MDLLPEQTAQNTGIAAADDSRESNQVFKLRDSNSVNPVAEPAVAHVTNAQKQLVVGELKNCNNQEGFSSTSNWQSIDRDIG